jgi:osmotically-inducible protein OsmY
MTTLTDHPSTNEALRVAVIRKIERHPDIHSSNLSVETYGPTVTLAGFVHTFAEKANAGTAAKSVSGVLSIANDLEVGRSTRTDPEIARDLQHGLESNLLVPQAKITPAVHDGFVTLEGTVEWNYERSAAGEAAEAVRGVRGVTNLVTINTRVSPSSVKQAIEAALHRNTEIDARQIQVSAYDDTVQLWGTVHFYAQRDEAERVARAAPGIESVVNRIQVTFPD